MAYQRVERNPSWWGLKNINFKKSIFTYDLPVFYNDRLVQTILLSSKESPNVSTKKYYVDLENFAVVRVEYNDDWIEYKLLEERWYYHKSFRWNKSSYSDERKSFIHKTVVSKIAKGKNNEIESLNHKIVREISYHISDWNDNFWEDYNYIKLDDEWNKTPSN